MWECQVYRKESLKGCSNPRVFELELDEVFKDMFNKLLRKRNVIFDEILNECKNYLETNNMKFDIKNLESKISALNNKKNKLLELVVEGYLDKVDYKRQVNILNKEINNCQSKIIELKSNKKTKNYIEGKINEIKKQLDDCLNDNECYSNIFNEIIDRIVVYKKCDKQIELNIFIKTGEQINMVSDSLGKKFHLINSYTTNNSRICCN